MCIDTCIDTRYAYHMTKMQIIGETQTPTGKPGYLIECTCRTNHGTGRAIVTAACGQAMKDNGTTDRIHGFVMLAHSPAGRLAAKMPTGPWAA